MELGLVQVPFLQVELDLDPCSVVTISRFVPWGEFTLTGVGVGSCRLRARAGDFSDEATVTTSHCTVFIPSILNCIVALIANFQNISQPALNGLAASQSISLAEFHGLQALLGESGEGRRLADLYWRHTGEVVQLVGAKPSLIPYYSNLFTASQPGILKLLSGKGKEFQITQPLIDTLNSSWDHLRTLASPELKAALESERARFNGFQNFVGKDFSQWAEMLKIPAPTKPWILASSPRFANSQFSVEANYVEGWDYSLWKSSDVVKPISEPVVAAKVQVDGYTVTLTDPTPSAANVFYQIRAQQKLGAGSGAQIQPAALLNDPKLFFSE